MAYNFTPFQQKMKDIEEWLKREHQGLRTGRATLAILDAVSVESYGSRMPINQLATVSTEDAKTIRISPWDATQLKGIEKAIRDSDLGLSVLSDDKGIRVIFPDLTSERRQQLAKVARAKLEEAKVSIRGEREKVWEDIQEREKAGEMSEDDKFRLKGEMQKIVDEANGKLETMTANKEKEIEA